MGDSVEDVARHLVEDIADAGDREHERRIGHECCCVACEDSRRAVAAAALTTATDSHGLRPEVLWFAQEMEKKLRANDHKGGWDDDEVSLYKRLKQEVAELGREVNADFMLNAFAVIREAADVGNFAMMIAHNIRIDRPDPTPRGTDQ